jgi:hypothetical protein
MDRRLVEKGGHLLLAMQLIAAIFIWIFLRFVLPTRKTGHRNCSCFSTFRLIQFPQRLQ